MTGQEKRVMRCAVFLAMAAVVGLAAAANAQSVRAVTTGPDESGARASVVMIVDAPGRPAAVGDGPRNVVLGGEPAGVKVIERPRPDEAAAPPRKMKITFLGVVTSPVGEALGEQLGLPRGVGLVVEFVEPDSPAAAAGLFKHDVLVRLEDQLLINQPQLAVLVRMRKPGQRVTVTLKRNAAERKIPVRLEETERLVAARPTFAAWPTSGMPRLSGKSLAELLKSPEAPDGLPQQCLINVLGHGPIMSIVTGPGGAAATASMSMSDGEHTLNVTNRNGENYLVAKDIDGHVIFDGPIQTQEQRQAVPQDIRRKLDRLAVLAEVRIHAPGDGHAEPQDRPPDEEP
jgi:serine protease Do